MVKITFLTFMLTAAFEAYAVSLLCNPETKDLWQTNKQFNFKGTCDRYSQERPSSVGCYLFRVEISTQDKMGYLDLGKVFGGRLITTSTKYSFSAADNLTEYEFEVDRRNLSFHKLEKFEMELPGHNMAMIDSEWGSCVIDTNDEEGNKI